jgi:hypothetical protein
VPRYVLDVAQAMVNSIREPQAIGRTYELVGCVCSCMLLNKRKKKIERKDGGQRGEKSYCDFFSWKFFWGKGGKLDHVITK